MAMDAERLKNAIWQALEAQGVVGSSPQEAVDKAKNAIKAMVREIIQEMINNAEIEIDIPANQVVVNVVGQATPVFNSAPIVLTGKGPSKGIKA